MTTTATRTPVAKLDLPLGTPVPHQIRDCREHVEVTRTIDGFHVAVWLGVTTVEDWTANYDDEQTMRSEVRRAIKAIHAYGGTELLRRRRETIALEIVEQQRRQLRRMHSAQTLADLHAEDDFTEPIGTRQGRLELARRFEAEYGQVAA